MDRVRRLLNEEAPVKWLFYGDSITHGTSHTFGWRDYVELFSERVRGELGRSMDIVINSAISGHTTRQLLDGYAWRVEQFHPDVVCLMIGMNDCKDELEMPVDEFRDNLNQLFDSNEGLGALTVFQTTCPILPGLAPEREPTFPTFMQTIREAARDKSAPLVDHLGHWQENEDSHHFWMSNAFHPNEYGHRAFARLIFQELGIFDAESRCCRLLIP
jgi:lysophospholipase L1-like esterase